MADYSNILTAVSTVTDPVVAQLQEKLIPLIGPATDAVMEKMQPFILTEVLPRVLFWGILGLLGAATLGALIASHFATRRRVYRLNRPRRNRRSAAYA